ncbi:CDP-diacylglycerol--glycerol-3-phosphate 3-phosphatidyltransferase [Photobacterium jeanii]|uniref:CDP-diacylglycerol--glycerol-3-phosphate 3-phosphatidyltransferase n=1 Tax=Photobacterium jeanii TaxID=858640 RepID=A0A178K8Z2_9GAMM|nr:CDP-diacylglycerol--glycerol-3-phosphate 3-phosphatidyltransferase [Photobacterium jeanii]OAN13819.1 CDP-diacylglycerol--glycerol-3-phosphate 3-phosphatidyltransferase [Photobacterium jeanii]PST92718.1 CDP-diacylglycerol--glycerol-3-phosphate 3-phosphatidyltransferase [Photobacterium jeanii]
MRLTIPNILSFIRLLLIPVFVIAFYLPYEWSPFATAFVFWVAGVTDWFDGYLARKLNQTTRFGAFIDPVADKLMVATALVLVVEDYHSIWITIPAVTMIGREIIISALREWMAELGKRSNVAVSWVGKVKTATQMFALFILLWHPTEWSVWLGYASLYVAMILTYWSMYQYLKAAKDDLFHADHM